MKRLDVLLASLLSFFGAVGIGAANATGTDFSSLTSAVDFSTAVTGVLACGAAIALVLIAVKGARMILSMLGR